MKLRLRLGGSIAADLADHWPAGESQIELPPGSCIADLIDYLGLDPERPLLSIVNGRVVGADTRGETVLNDGDELALVPAIRAG